MNIIHLIRMLSKERHVNDEHINAIIIQKDVLNTAKQEGLVEEKAKGRTGSKSS